MKQLKLIVVLILMMSFLFPQSSFAKDTKKVGNVVSISGTVDIKKAGGKKLFKAFKNMAFTQGDTIITGSNGKAKLSIDKDKEVSVAADTELVISELVSSIEAKSGKTKLTLVDGKVKVKISKKLEGESRFTIQTPDAIMGVMGTEFYVYYDEQGTWVGVLEGEVKVEIEGSDPISIYANQSLLIDDSGSWQVIELDEEQLLRFEAESSETLLSRLTNLLVTFDSISKKLDVAFAPDIPDVPVVAVDPVDWVDQPIPPVDPPNPPVGPVDPPPVQTPTLVSAENYNADPSQRDALTIVYIAHGDTLTKVFRENDQGDMDEVEGIHYEIQGDSIIFGQEFLWNMLQIDRTEIELEFASGFILPVTLLQE